MKSSARLKLAVYLVWPELARPLVDAFLVVPKNLPTLPAPATLTLPPRACKNRIKEYTRFLFVTQLIFSENRKSYGMKMDLHKATLNFRVLGAARAPGDSNTHSEQRRLEIISMNERVRL